MNNNSKELAKVILKILRDDELRSELVGNTAKDARKYAWEETAKEFFKVM